MNGYILDTNIFNAILDESYSMESLPDCVDCFATQVQLSEISNTRKQERRRQLLETFMNVPKTTIGTSTFIMNESLLNRDNIGPAITFTNILERLDARNKKSNNYRDALIGEVALNKSITLVTNDKDLKAVISEMGGSSISWNEFKGMNNKSI